MQKKSSFFLSLRWACFLLLLTAVVFRLADGADILSYSRACPAQAPAPALRLAPEFPTLYYTPPTHENAPQTVDASLVSVRNPTGAELDLQSLMAQPIAMDPDADGPLILIVHTHATEAYTPTPGEEYAADGAFRTLDTAHNVVRVGQAMAQRLNENGIQTLHDTTLNDVPGYNDAYERMAEVIEGYLQAYPSIRMVIDLHRDSIETDEGGELALTTQLGGQSAAQLLLVMGSDIAGLEHPNWRCNLGFALRLQAYCAADAPELFRDLTLRTQRYNEHLTPYSVLLEVGAAGNTLPEAICSAEYLADRLAALLQSNDCAASTNTPAGASADTNLFADP